MNKTSVMGPIPSNWIQKEHGLWIPGTHKEEPLNL